MSTSASQPVKTRKLGELKKGQTGTIVSVRGNPSIPADLVMIQRLLEMGLLEGATVELVHEAPFGGDPVAVRVRGSLVALRRQEANHVEVTHE
ncbi:MAG: ferrous iron transport protein A [Methylotenera sp.]|nr:ferrous iron transport protein A [Oligoflexia bacterium]